MREGLRWIPYLLCMLCATCPSVAFAAPPNPVLNSVFPAGGSVGETVEIKVAGDALAGLTALAAAPPGVSIVQVAGDTNRFRLSIDPGTPVGDYDIRAVCENGLSCPRAFVVGNRREQLEPEMNEQLRTAPLVGLDTVINGRIEKAADVDFFRFEASQGQRVIVECVAERIDSKLRPVVELFNLQGNHLSSGRGNFGVDPLIDFHVPEDGQYVVKLHDLTFTGSSDHYYRLAIDTGPRVAFAFPPVVQQGRPAHVTLYGWNLTADGHGNAKPTSVASPASTNTTASTFDRIDVEIPIESVRETWPLPIRLLSTQTAIRALPYYFSGSSSGTSSGGSPASMSSGHAPVAIYVTDIPVVTDLVPNHTPATTQHLDYPCEVSGQLATGNEQDWFAIDARRGEVLYIEGIARRINSQADLDIRMLDASAENELAQLGDELENVGGTVFPTDHLDPSGRWRVPADGRYLLLVRDLIGSSQPDPQRTYRLSIRREDPDVSLAVVPHGNEPAGVNVARGGRTLLDVIALRRRGLAGSIRVSADGLPSGVTCPDVWLGPEVNRAPLVLSADPEAPDFVGALTLKGFASMSGPRPVRGGVVVRSGLPRGWARLTAEVPLAIAGQAPIRISANGHEPRDHQLFGALKVRHSPGGILDVAVAVQRQDGAHQAAVQLTGVGLPDLIQNQSAIIPPGGNKGYISFYLPPTLPLGHYSLTIQGATTIPTSAGKTETVTVYSNVVSFEVHQAAFRLEVDQFAPRRIKRGEVLQINYSARRKSGFINKIHTELAEPGTVTDVVGLRGRGVTFVGQTETGTIQIIANDDAPLGQQPFLRLYGVGVVEDQPQFHGSCWLNLEVVE